MPWTKQRTADDFGEVYDALNDCLETVAAQNYI